MVASTFRRRFNAVAGLLLLAALGYMLWPFVVGRSGPSFSPSEFFAAFPLANVSSRGETLIASVSDRDGGDFSGQVHDAVAYLKNHEKAISLLLAYPNIGVTLDFGVWRKDVFSQSSSFPAELVRLAGALGLGLEVSMYANPNNSFKADGSGAA